jgi:hypothetical protein
MVPTLIARNSNEATVAPVVECRRARVSRQSVVWSQGAFGSNMASVTSKMFSHLVYMKINFIDVLSVGFAEKLAAVI